MKNDQHPEDPADSKRTDWTTRDLFGGDPDPFRLEKGVPVFSERDKIEHFYVLKNGLLGLYRFVQPSKRILLQKITPGSTTGATQLLMGRPYPAHLVPIKESIAYRGTKEQLKSFKDRDPEALTQLLLEESEVHCEIYEKIENVLSGNVDERIARELLDLAGEIGRTTDDGDEIVVKLSRKDISQMVGCSHETASRVMSKWEKDGTIKTDHKKITIRSPHRLRSYL